MTRSLASSYFARPCERSQSIFRLPDSQSSQSSLLFSALMKRSSSPGDLAVICHSSGVRRFILKLTRSFAMPAYRLNWRSGKPPKKFQPWPATALRGEPNHFQSVVDLEAPHGNHTESRPAPYTAQRQGWCPPVPILRRLGFRTSFEIEQERQALKLIRGDYKTAAAGEADVEDIIEAVQ